MSQTTPGQIGWIDLTVPDASRIRDFYSAVAGWKPEPVEMGGYSDFTMMSSDGKPVAGVCHARGTNSDLPSCWLIYITVADLAVSLAQVAARDGRVRVGPKQMGSYGRYAVIEDPAGACCVLFQPA